MHSSYTRTPQAAKFVEQALTKLLIYWQDGGSRTFYNRTRPKNRSVEEHRTYSLGKHRKYCQENAASIRVAMVYDARTGAELYKFKNGAWV